MLIPILSSSIWQLHKFEGTLGINPFKSYKIWGTHVLCFFFWVKKLSECIWMWRQPKQIKKILVRQTDLLVCVCVCERTMYVMDINWPTTQQTGWRAANRLHVNCLWLGCTSQPKNKGLKFSLFPITSFINNMYKQVSWKTGAHCTDIPLHN